MAHVIPDYRIQIQNDGKWLSINYANTAAGAQRIAAFELGHGRSARIQKIKDNGRYQTIPLPVSEDPSRR